MANLLAMIWRHGGRAARGQVRPRSARADRGSAHRAARRFRRRRVRRAARCPALVRRTSSVPASVRLTLRCLRSLLALLGFEPAQGFSSWTTLRVTPGWAIPSGDGQFADAEGPALVEASERRQKPSRNIAAFRPRQLVDIALQAFTDAFQAAAEREITSSR